MFTTLVGLLPFLASAQAYFILSHNVLETTRLDPIVNPGGISSHVHSVVGGSNFDKQMTFESARASTCTTAYVSEDKSNYWTPQLYYYSPTDASYQAIPVSYVNTYYLPRAGKDGKVHAFPDGLRMISGNPNRRTFNNDADSKAATYVCLDYSGGHQGDPEWAERNSFFNHNCPQGMRAQIFFRSCWDGVNLDSADHVSHMAWPSGGVDGGECPSTHPVRLVSLFYEFIYSVQDFPFNDPQYPTWVFANGDTTGYGMHGDFVNGWPSLQNGTNILQQAIDGCNDNNGVGGELQNCPPFVPYLKGGACGPQNAQVGEDIGMGHSIPKLPGNNPIWIGNGTKPSYANYTEGNTTYTDFKSVIPTGYTEVGCIAEGTSGRALAAKSLSTDNMTRAVCVQFCSDNGFPLAGVEYGRECYCDVAMKNGATNTTLLDSSKCSSKCANNTNEYCGGASTLSLFNNPSLYVSKSLPTGWTANGCVTEGSSSRALKSYSFTSDAMTQELCINGCQAKGYTIAGIEWSRECYCGNAFTTGAVAAKDADCGNVCSGDATEICGGSQRLTTFVYSNSTTPATTASASASANATSSAVSNSTSIASSSTASINATSAVSSSTSKASSSAISSTAASSNATSVASSTTSKASSAASSSTVSSTSSVVPSSSSASASASSSSSIGNVAIASPSASASKSSSSSSVVASSTATSTAASSTTISSTVSSTPVASFSTVSSTTSTSSSAAASATVVAGWQSEGCYSEGSGGRALGGYSFSASNMTIGYCTSTCQGQGWKYAGIEYSSECYCGDTFNFGSATAPSTDCKMKCSGDSTQACGGSYRLSVYSNPSVTVQNTLPSGWTESGCYTEVSGRALKGYSFTSGSMTPTLCASTCASKGYKLAGSEYSGECYCSNTLDSGSSNVDSSQCANTCKGDVHQICGGSSRLSLYTYGSTAQANAKVAVAASSSSSSSSAAASSSSSVVSSSSTAASSSSVASSSAASSTSTAKSSTTSSTTSTATSTTTSSTAASTASPSPSVTSTSSAAPAASSTSSSSQIAPATVPASGYVGCLTDRGNPRTLNGTSVSSNAMTNALCSAHCARNGYAFAGTQYSRECWCGSYLNQSWQTSDATCSMKCNGDNSQYCGGNYLLTVYATGNGTQVVYGTKSTKRALSRRRSSRISL